MADKKTERHTYIDIIRIIAIVNVVIVHILPGVYKAGGLKDIPAADNIFRIFVFVICRTFGVPLFLMISGFLLLDKSYDTDMIKKFWKDKWLRLIVCTFIWFFIYDLFLKYVMRSDMPWDVVLSDIVMMHKGTMPHQWYMPMIIGFYLLMPFAANALASVRDARILLMPIIFIFFITSGIEIGNIILQQAGITGSFVSQINTGFSGGIYGLYIILGYMVKKGCLKKINTYLLISIIVICVIVMTIFHYRVYSYSYYYWYDFPLIVPSSLSLFELMSRIRFHKSGMILFMARYSFSVYLLHMIVIYLLRKLLDSRIESMPVRLVAYTLAALAICYLTAWMISRIPKIGRYILYL